MKPLAGLGAAASVVLLGLALGVGLGFFTGGEGVVVDGSGATFTGAGEGDGETAGGEGVVGVVAVPLVGLQRLPSERFLRVTAGTWTGSGAATRATTARW
jgi:hypothetical protein